MNVKMTVWLSEVHWWVFWGQEAGKDWDAFEGVRNESINGFRSTGSLRIAAGGPANPAEMTKVAQEDADHLDML